MLEQRIIPENKYGVKCPYSMTPEFIVIHNTANDASADNEASYMATNNNEVSFHIVVDDIKALQLIPFNRNSWHAGDGNGDGNRKGIGLEICYSKSGGERFIKAEQRAAKEIAALLKVYGWGIDKVKKHQDFSGKYCPHRTLDMGWQRFLNMVQTELNGPLNICGELYRVRKSWVDSSSQKGAYSSLDNAKKECDKHKGYSVYDNAGNSIYTNFQEAKEKIDAFYKVKSAGIWYQEVKNLTDYAGYFGKAMECIMARLSKGTIEYRVSPVNSNYYDWVRDYSDYAGLPGKCIDRVQMRLIGLPNQQVRYRVKLVNGTWLDWVIGDSDFAGIRGKLIDALEIEII